MFQKFIKASNEYTEREKAVPAPYIRRGFELDFVPQSAKLYICTPGFYELFVNGKKITKGALAPYISNPDHICCYDEYDVSNLLVRGKNALGFILGNGFANQCSDQWQFSQAPFRAPLCASVYLKADDGADSFELCSDESFKTHPSPIIFDMYRYGTHYDARLEIDGWAESGFDDSAWKNVLEAEVPKGEKLYCTAEPVTLQGEVGAESVEYQEDFSYLKTSYFNGENTEFTHVNGGYLYDFGKSMSGVCRIKIKGKHGQKVTIRHGERLSPEGNFNINSIYTFQDDYKNYIHLFQTDVYILKGGEEEIYSPSFTYHGFRYAFVEGIESAQATKDLLTFEVINSNIAKRADFSCSDKVMNTLFDMGVRADVSNFHYFPTDCPHREKNGWTGDAAASAEQLMLLFDCSNSFFMWLKSMQHSQKGGMLPGIVPTSGWGYAWGNGPAWDSAAVFIPYYVYKYDGRVDILRDNADMIIKYLKYISGRRDGEGLIAVGLGDWCQPGGNQNIAAPLKLTDTAMVYDMAVKSSFIFNVLNMKEEKAYADDLARELRRDIRKNLINSKTMSAAGNCQTSQALCLSLGIFEKEERAQAYERLIEFITEKSGHVHCGVIGLRHIFEVLVNGGDADLALDMICREDAPSYGAMIKRGATALCEALEENGVQESQNHHFFGDIMRVFISLIAGLKINPKMNDINQIEISPAIPARLKRASAEYNSECGKIKTSWEKEGDKIKVFAHIPKGIKGRFVFGNINEELHAGDNEFII